MFPTPEIATAEHVAIGNTSVLLNTVMVPGEHWVFSPSVACYLAQGDETVVAAATDGSIFLNAGDSIMVEPGFANGNRLAVIRQTNSGVGTLTRVRFLSEV